MIDDYRKMKENEQGYQAETEQMIKNDVESNINSDLLREFGQGKLKTHLVHNKFVYSQNHLQDVCFWADGTFNLGQTGEGTFNCVDDKTFECRILNEVFTFKFDDHNTEAKLIKMCSGGRLPAAKIVLTDGYLENGLVTDSDSDEPKVHKENEKGT